MARRSRGSREGPRVSRGEPHWDVPRTVHLYRDPSSATLNVGEVARYLRDTLGLICDVRDEFLVHHGGDDLEDLARRIAGMRVRNILRPPEPMEPLYGEIRFELRLLEDPAKRVPAILYDGYRYDALLRDLLPPEERSLSVVHVAFIHRLLGTFGEDGRYHARTNVLGFPCIVSTSGIVEAPAKPPAYYEVKARLSLSLGATPFEAAKEPFKGQFIDYDDPRLTEVAKGYALQCVMYHITKEPFCEDPACRLFNAHRQSELLAAQIESGRLCKRHVTMAEAIARVARDRAGTSRTRAPPRGRRRPRR